MSVNSTLRIEGVKEALAELNKTQKKLRREITREYKEIVQPVVTEARQLVPREAPLSGWNRSWTPKGASSSVLPYQAGRGGRAPRQPSAREMNFPGGRRQMGKWMQWQAGLNAYISGKRPVTTGGYTRNLAAFGVRWQGPAAVLFDTSAQASTPQGQQMIAALRARYGPPSRVMWRAYGQTSSQVQGELRKLVEKIMREAGRSIARKGN